MPTPKTASTVLKIVARLPISLVIADESTAPSAQNNIGVSGFLRKQVDEANGSFQPLLTSLHPLKSETEPFGFCLTASECTWTLAAASEEDYLRWLRALCYSAATGVPFSAVHAKYKRMFQLQEVSADAITDVRMLIDIYDTVDEIVKHIFNCYTSALDAAHCALSTQQSSCSASKMLLVVGVVTCATAAKC